MRFCNSIAVLSLSSISFLSREISAFRLSMFGSVCWMVGFPQPIGSWADLIFFINFESLFITILTLSSKLLTVLKSIQ